MAQVKLLILGSKKVVTKDGTDLFLASTADGKQVWSAERIDTGSLVVATERKAGEKYMGTDDKGAAIEKTVMKDGFNLDIVIPTVAGLDSYAAMQAKMTTLGF